LGVGGVSASYKMRSDEPVNLSRSNSETAAFRTVVSATVLMRERGKARRDATSQGSLERAHAAVCGEGRDGGEGTEGHGAFITETSFAV
jgi:hypothetical protein